MATGWSFDLYETYCTVYSVDRISNFNLDLNSIQIKRVDRRHYLQQSFKMSKNGLPILGTGHLFQQPLFHPIAMSWTQGIHDYTYKVELYPWEQTVYGYIQRFWIIHKYSQYCDAPSSNNPKPNPSTVKQKPSHLFCEMKDLYCIWVSL